MKNKKLLLLILTLVVILNITILIYIFIINKNNLSRINEIYSESHKMIEENEKKDISFQNNTEKAIYDYFDNIYNKINEIKDNSYENYITDEINSNLYVNNDLFISNIKDHNSYEEELLNTLIKSSNKENFIKYLKDNKVNFIYINHLKKMISNENLIEIEKTIEKVNDDKEKYNILITYAEYLKDNNEQWKYENNKIICKNLDILNYIVENNKNIGIDKKIIMEQRSNKNIPVLMYHGVSDITWGIANLFMRVDDFENQLKYIHDNYETIFIEDIEDYYGDKKTVALTFDDGYVDFYTNVLPLLKKYNLKANLYIITGNKSEKFLSDEQIKEINNSGLVSIGSHTVNHNDLTSLNREELINELKNSKKSIEELLGKEIKTICYPAGSYNALVLEETANYYEYGLIIGGDVQTMDNNFNKVAIKRYRIYRNTGFSNFKRMVDSAT